MDCIWSDHVFLWSCQSLPFNWSIWPIYIKFLRRQDFYLSFTTYFYVIYLFALQYLHYWVSLVAQPQRTRLPVQEMRVGSLGCEDPLEKEMASHSSIPAWEIPWTDKPGELQSMCHERVGHDLATKQLPNYCVKYFQVNCFILLSFLSIFFPPSSSLLSFRNFHHVYVDKLVDVSQVFEPVFIIFFLFIHYSFSFLLHRLDCLSLCPDSWILSSACSRLMLSPSGEFFIVVIILSKTRV